MSCPSCIVALSGVDDLPSTNPVCKNFTIVAAGTGVLVGALAFMLTKNKGTGMAAGVGALTAVASGLGMFAAKEAICKGSASAKLDPAMTGVMTGGGTLLASEVPAQAASSGGGMSSGLPSMWASIAADAAASQGSAAQASPAPAAKIDVSYLPAMPSGSSAQPSTTIGRLNVSPTVSAAPDPSSSVRTVLPTDANTGGLATALRYRMLELANPVIR